MSKTITGTFKNIDGTALSGTISFELLAPFDDGTNIYMPDTTVCTLDTNGQFSVALPTPATGITTYRVTYPDETQAEIAIGTGASANIADLVEFPPSSQYPYYSTVLASAPALVVSGAARLISVILMAGSANSRVDLKNALTDSGAILMAVDSQAGTTTGIDLSSVGGIVFDTGIYCKPVGTGAIAHVWYV